MGFYARLFGGRPNVRRLARRKRVSKLIEALQYTDDKEVRADAAKALRDFADHPQREEIVSALAEALHDSSESVQTNALASLIAILPDKFLEIFKEQMRYRPSLKRSVLTALASLGRKKELLEIAAEESDPQLKRRIQLLVDLMPEGFGT